MTGYPVRLRELRLAVGLSLADAAALAGCPEAELCRVETGQRPASRAEFAELIGVYVAVLVTAYGLDPAPTGATA